MISGDVFQCNGAGEGSSTLKLVTKRNEKVLQDIEALKMHLQEETVLDLVGQLANDMQGIVV